MIHLFSISMLSHIFQGLYDMNIEVLGLPMLPWEPPALCDTVKAR